MLRERWGRYTLGVADDQPLFHWDENNHDHIARHGVSPEEAEQAILDPHAILLEIETRFGEERTEALGITASGQVLLVVSTFVGRAIRPITAYKADARLEKLYFEQGRL